MKHFKREDGQSCVQLERTYPHPIERVWKAVTQPSELAHWFPSRMEITDGRIRFFGDPNIGQDTFGEVLENNPPRCLRFTWGNSELHFELETLGDSSTRFVLTQVLAHENESARNAAGWQICLQGLDRKLTGESAHRLWDEYYHGYIEKGVPSGAPIPGKPQT